MPTVLAEFSVTPVADGPIKPFIDSAIQQIEKSGLKHEVGPLGTTVQGDLDQVLFAIKQAHTAVLDQGVERVVTEIRIDEKKGGLSMEEEIEGYR
jgi:uncharacterized protein (TIGR00106 family)